MINDDGNNCYYFAIKNLSELYSLGLLRSKKETIINGDNDFQNAFYGALIIKVLTDTRKEYQN